jgi:hypothetical protein
MQDPESLKAIIEYLWGLMTIVFSGLFLHLYKKINDTFSKAETKEMIDLKILVLIESVDRHNNSIKAQTSVMEKLNDSIQLLHRDMSVVKTEVENLKHVNQNH